MKIEDAIKRYESWAEDDQIDVRIRKEHRQIADDINELNFCCCCGSRNKVRRKGADNE